MGIVGSQTDKPKSEEFTRSKCFVFDNGPNVACRKCDGFAGITTVNGNSSSICKSRRRKAGCNCKQEVTSDIRLLSKQ